MDFLDATTWETHDPRAKALRDLFASCFPRKAELVALAIEAGAVEARLRVQEPTVELMWTAVLPDLAAQSLLRRLVEAAKASPRMGARFTAGLATALAAGPARAAGGLWYRCPDPVQARFVRPAARRGVVDRDRLRKVLPTMRPGLALVVRGPRRSGKSHTWHLINHIAQEEDSFTPVWIRVEEFTSASVTGDDLAGLLADKLSIDLDDTGPADTREQDAATTRISVASLLPGFPRDGERRCLVIDGLDRDEAAESAKAFGLRLLEAVCNQEIVDTHVVLTGFDRPIPADLVDFVEDEQLQELTFTEIRQFFQVVSDHTGRPLAAGRLDELADEVLRTATGGGAGPVPIADRAVVAAQVARREFAGEAT